MKRIGVFFLALLCFAHYSYAQFKEVIGGFARPAKASILAVSTAGGGVVFKGKTLVNKQDYSKFLDFKLKDEISGEVQLAFQTALGSVQISIDKSMLRDAAMLVNWESSENEMYRDVNLNGSPDSDEDSIKYPQDSYWYVEMADPLIGTKSGEILLLADLLLTDINFYSDEENYEIDKYLYKLTTEGLQVKDMKFSYDVYMKFDSLQEIQQLSQLDSFRYVHIKTLAVETLYDGMFTEQSSTQSFETIYTAKQLIKTMHMPTNWTLNDEHTKYDIEFDYANNSLSFSGSPVFTFLTFGFQNKVFTDYFTDNSEIIDNLNVMIMNSATEFAQIAAFLRYIQTSEPQIWLKIFDYCQGIKRVDGQTPRIIRK